ncbi:MAG: hypothetical protein A2912_02015 [Candidatus Buchananbacteria bacterium RIFCSPLOWO2_01_FULL_40_23b]|uniref:Uncharacterized protein n=1 Tax=Candidatus Buchananbacteria bacterium RIFCSPLOWO2_01_FULL_40_23b TaxID=1797544 RepID=A0A1G1YPK4_9BACT|nr:MAG: hypothetical protein A2912_02015 [Candidatus Buchananbacteria bacterium RIFCSPLOWO2_01_FULL_40_23b]
MTHSTNLNYLLFDKDETLGEFWNDTGIYPAVPQFLQQQQNNQQKIVIVTSAITTAAKQHLQPIDQYIHRYIGKEHYQNQKVSSRYIQIYIDSENNVRELEIDYQPRSQTLPQAEVRQLEQQRTEQRNLAWNETNKEKQTQYRNKMNEITEYLDQLLHKQTQQPFDPSTLYQNPYNKDLIGKDLHLVRHYLDPQHHQHLRNIMIGDLGDGMTMPQTDPYTPVIIINHQQREGNWQPVSNLIDILNHKSQLTPWQVFDEIYQQGTPETVQRDLLDNSPQQIKIARFNNQTYELDTANNGRRIVVKE